MSWADELGADEQWSWVHGRGELSLDRAGVMAIINLTPDSFSDGGRFGGGAAVDVDAVARVGAEFVAHGADILDVGGESTRPGAEPVSSQEECARVLDSVRRLAALACPVSVDTRNASTAAAAMEAGAAIINDVSGLADPAMADVAAEHGAGLVVGHLRGVPSTMQHQIAFDDLLAEVAAELAEAVERAGAAGVAKDKILVDPGIGFGKTPEQSAALVSASRQLRAHTGCRVLVGASRKSFLVKLGPGLVAETVDRRVRSVAAALVAVGTGASMVRVHDVHATCEALAALRELRHAARRVGAPSGGRQAS